MPKKIVSDVGSPDASRFPDHAGVYPGITNDIEREQLRAAKDRLNGLAINSTAITIDGECIDGWDFGYDDINGFGLQIKVGGHAYRLIELMERDLIEAVETPPGVYTFRSSVDSKMYVLEFWKLERVTTFPGDRTIAPVAHTRRDAPAQQWNSDGKPAKRSTPLRNADGTLHTGRPIRNSMEVWNDDGTISSRSRFTGGVD